MGCTRGDVRTVAAVDGKQVGGERSSGTDASCEGQGVGSSPAGNCCQCSAPGYCEFRGRRVNKLLWDKCQAGHCDAVTRLLLGAEASSLPAIQQKMVSTVGTQIREVIERAIGRSLSCRDCLGYLSNLNVQTTHDHEAIVKYLSANFPWPIEWREKNTRRREAISALIAPVVPAPVVDVVKTLEYPLKFVTTVQVAVRVAKRSTPRWHETVASIKSAGFSDPLLYCEPDAGVPGNVVWPEKKGPIGSFKAMCLDLLESTTAEWFLLCEDDIALSLHTADYLRKFNLTNEVYSLYTAATRQQDNPQWSEVKLPLIGSLALLMRRSTLQTITETSQWAKWPKHDCVDQLVYRACAEKNIPLLTHNPSIVQHTGDTAAIYTDRKLTGNRVAKDWTLNGLWTPPLVTVITPTGDRPEAFSLCEKWMSQQTYTGKIQWIVVDDGVQPTTCTMGQERIQERPIEKHSLCRNLRAAIPRVEGEYIFIVEDDDYYAPHYLSTMVGRLQRADLVGEFGAKYYYLRHQSYRHNHSSEHHASLCRTGMTRNVLETLRRCAEGCHPSVDLRLWRAWKGSTFSWRDADGTQSLCVGIKGVEGRQSRGWRPSKNAVYDTGFATLRKWVGPDAASIYQGIMQRVQ